MLHLVKEEMNHPEDSLSLAMHVYQGVRMWSCVVKMQPETIDSITSHIRKQLIKEE